MKENENKELERLADWAMQNAPLETPSFDFTARVMAQATEMPKKAVPAYTPLLPRYFWAVLGIAVAGLLGYAYFAGSEAEPASYGMEPEGLYSRTFHDMASSLKFSKTTMYAAVALLLAMLAQIPIIRNRFGGPIEQ